MASSPPDGAVPPPPDGATDVPATITPPSGSVEGTNAEAPDRGANKSWAAGSQDANAAAWAAYQQQYAYQYAGGEWSAYHAAWATEYARHNESMAAAAAAPSPEQLAHVAAKIAEQLATVENENNTKNAKQPKSGDAETQQNIDGVSGEEEAAVKAAKESSRRLTHPPPPPQAPPSPPPPPPDAEPKVSQKSARKNESEKTRYEEPVKHTLVPRQISPPTKESVHRLSDVVPRRERVTTWQEVAADALHGVEGDKSVIAAERARLAREIEQSRSRLEQDASARGRETQTNSKEKPRRRGASLERYTPRGREGRDRRERESKRTRLEGRDTGRDDTTSDSAGRKPKKQKSVKDRLFWEKHYAAKYGLALDDEAKDGMKDETRHYPKHDHSNDNSSAAATATTEKIEQEMETRRETRDLRRDEKTETTSRRGERESDRDNSPRDDLRGSSRDVRGRQRASVPQLTRSYRLPTLKGQRAAYAWGPNGTPPSSPERDEDDDRRTPAAKPSQDMPEIPSPMACVKLTGMTTREELLDSNEADEILKETEEECLAFGKVVDIKAVLPNPLGTQFDDSDVGTVYLLFDTLESAERARKSLHGRTFADRPVTAEIVEKNGVF